MTVNLITLERMRWIVRWLCGYKSVFTTIIEIHTGIQQGTSKTHVIIGNLQIKVVNPYDSGKS